jgi:hypothetical protein
LDQIASRFTLPIGETKKPPFAELTKTAPNTVLKKRSAKAKNAAAHDAAMEAKQEMADNELMIAYDQFMEEFGNNFCGTKDRSHLDRFETLVSAIDPEDFPGSVSAEWTRNRDHGKRKPLYCAAKSKKAMVKALAAVFENELPEDETEPAPVIDSKHWQKQFGISPNWFKKLLADLNESEKIDISNSDQVEEMAGVIKEHYHASKSNADDTAEMLQWLYGRSE